MNFEKFMRCKTTIKIFIPLLLLSLISCADDAIKPQKISLKIKELPDQESWNAKVIFSDSGYVRTILRAGYIAVYNSRNETILDGGIQVDFFDKDRNHTSVLTADRGKVDDLTQDLYAYGNVIARSDSGVVLKTEELRWINSKKKIVTDKFVEITSPNEEIRGYGLESDQSLKNYLILRVSGRIETRE